MAKPDSHTLTASEDDNSTRLDRFLVSQLPEMSRSRLQDLVAQGCVTCNGKAAVDSAAKVKSGQVFVVTMPEIVASHILPQDIKLDIIYEDEHLLVINKPAGLTVHPAPGHPDMTLVNALLAHCGSSLSGIGGVARPGIVHRIDKETSGLLVVAKHDAAHLHLSAQLADRSLKRTYNAIVWGKPKLAAGTVTGNIGRSSSNRQKMAVVRSGGKAAVTHYKVVAVFPLPLREGVRGWGPSLSITEEAPPPQPSPSRGEGAMASLIECKLETGRTHQIRVHMAFAGYPLLGDPVYGQTTLSRLMAGPYKSMPAELREALLNFKRQALHARELGLIHPETGKAMRFECELPWDMKELIEALEYDKVD